MSYESKSDVSESIVAQLKVSKRRPKCLAGQLITKPMFRQPFGRSLAKMSMIRRNPARYHLCTPWHADYNVHRRYQAQPGFEHLRAYLRLVSNPIDPSVSDSRLDHLKTLEGSFCEFVEHAANLRGAYRAWPSLNGCTKANHLAFEATVRAGDKVLLTTGCHRSVEDWLFLKCQQGFDLELAYITTAWSNASETYLPPSAEEVERAVRDHSDARLVVITCPTYPGLYPLDLPKTIQTIRHYAPEARILIDGAWASHFGFSPLVPDFPINSGADLVTSSDHKTGLAEEQAAMLYLGLNDPELAERIDTVFRAFSTTSPSHRLLSSLEASLLTQETAGQQLIRDAVDFANRFKQVVKQLEGLNVLDVESLGADPQRFVQDPLKVFVDTSALGFSGRRVYRLLEQQERLIAEMATERGVLFLFNPAYELEDADDCAERLLNVLTVNDPKEYIDRVAPPPAPHMVVSPASIFSEPPEYVPLQKTIGKVAATAVGIYPPGIYVIRPGQLVDEPTVCYLQQALSDETQATVQGMVNGKIPVISTTEQLIKSIDTSLVPVEAA